MAEEKRTKSSEVAIQAWGTSKVQVGYKLSESEQSKRNKVKRNRLDKKD